MWADYECEDDADDGLGASTHAVCATDIHLFNNESNTLKEILLLQALPREPGTHSIWNNHHQGLVTRQWKLEEGIEK